MGYEIQAGLTSQLIDIFVQDSSVSTGAGLTGLAYNTASLTCYYKRQGASSWTSVSLATMTQGTWASGGFIVGDGTNAPGMYEFGIPDAAIASGAGVYWVDFMFKGAANMAPVPLRITLIGINNTKATVGKQIPNADASAAGGLLTFGTGTGQVNPASGNVTTTYSIKKNTAFTAFCLQMVLSSDHVTPATGKTVTLTRSIDGGAYGASTAGTMTEISNGTYKINLSASDLNGNMISLLATATGCDQTVIGIVTQA